MAALISLNEAKTQLRISLASTAFDTELESKRLQASEIIINYLDNDTASAWTDETVPETVKAAILAQLTALFERQDAGIPQGVKDLLRRFRKPVAL